MAKPIDRWELVAGKWLGCAVVATACLALMVGGTAALGRWVAGAGVEHLAGAFIVALVLFQRRDP